MPLPGDLRRRRARPAVHLLILASCSSCLAGFVWTIDYEFEASAVRRRDGAETRLETSSRGRRVDIVCADDSASFSIRVRPGAIEATVRNPSKTPLRLDLERARLVGPDGRRRALYAAGPNNTGPPRTVVAPGSETTVFVWPQAWLRGRIGGRGSTWRADSPIDGGLIAERSRGRAEELAEPHLGQSIVLILPVAGNDSMTTYRFRLTVRRIVPKRISWA